MSLTSGMQASKTALMVVSKQRMVSFPDGSFLKILFLTKVDGWV